MPSPSPDMDPYLGLPSLRGDVHHPLISVFRMSRRRPPIEGATVTRPEPCLEAFDGTC